MGADANTEINKIIIKSEPRELLLFFIVNVSGSMQGSRIGMINEALTELISDLRHIQMDCLNELELKITILTFSEYAEVLVPPTPVMEYTHDTIQCTPGVTNYSRTFELLNSWLSTCCPKHEGKLVRPCIFLLTSGTPTMDDFRSPLKNLKENFSFEHSSRFAFLIDDTDSSSRFAEALFNNFVSESADVVNVTNADKIHSRVVSEVNRTAERLFHDPCKTMPETHTEPDIALDVFNPDLSKF